MEPPSPPPQDLEEYSASSTTIAFDRLVPLLRSEPGDDPSAGPEGEEREMEGCLAPAREKCGGFAKGRCLKSFRDARIAAWVGDLSPKQAEKLACWTTMADRGLWIDLVGCNRLVRLGLSDREFRATNYRASELLGSSTDVDSILGGASEVVITGAFGIGASFGIH